MALHRMRCTSTGADMTGAKPRDGAMACGIDEPRPGCRDLHIHLRSRTAVTA
jgi:hypothetical protein